MIWRYVPDPKSHSVAVKGRVRKRQFLEKNSFWWIPRTNLVLPEHLLQPKICQRCDPNSLLEIHQPSWLLGLVCKMIVVMPSHASFGNISHETWSMDLLMSQTTTLAPPSLLKESLPTCKSRRYVDDFMQYAKPYSYLVHEPKGNIPCSSSNIKKSCIWTRVHLWFKFKFKFKFKFY